MNFLNKTFKNKVTGEAFTIIDVYQNIAITDKKEKINTQLLQNTNIFLPINESVFQTPGARAVPPTIDQSGSEVVDPNNFFNSQNIYNTFADKIKDIPLEKVPEDRQDNFVNKNYINSPDFSPSFNDSAIIMSSKEEEEEELRRKYGVISVEDQLKRQNEVFSQIIDEDVNQTQVVQVERPQNTNPQVEVVSSSGVYYERPTNVQQIESPVKSDPLLDMFKNVKRNIDFNIDLKIDGKIPRLDFIEMMEDSYEISIIDYLSDEFTRNLIKDPTIIKDKIKSEIKRLLESNSKSLPQTKQIVKESQNKPARTRVSRKKTTPVKNDS